MKSNTTYTLITGATSGIGKELAKLFVADGSNLVIVGRDNTSLQQTAAELKNIRHVEIITIVKDLFEKDAAFEIYDEIQTTGLQIDVLVNNAGQGQYGEFTNTNIERELNIIQLNICSLVVLTKLFLKDMVSRKSGKILNLSSVASKVPGPLQSVYHATKAFVQSFTEAVREEVKDSGVTITSLLPGATATDFFKKADMLRAKNVVEGDHADAANVAKDGYDALMKGDDMVISGFMNKVQVAMSNITPDSMVAKQVHKQQMPVEENQK